MGDQVPLEVVQEHVLPFLLKQEVFYLTRGLYRGQSAQVPPPPGTTPLGQSLCYGLERVWRQITAVIVDNTSAMLTVLKGQSVPLYGKSTRFILHTLWHLWQTHLVALQTSPQPPPQPYVMILFTTSLSPKRNKDWTVDPWRYELTLWLRDMSARLWRPEELLFAQPSLFEIGRAHV